MQVAIGAIIAGKYELERPLARGGMGSVWIARHVKLGSRLAVKFLDARFAGSASFLDRFEREARAAAALQSPHVVHVQDYGVEETTPYLVMELLQGEDLGARLHRLGRLSVPETARILVQVGKALRKAHDAGIVHRDLKPANLFLASLDDEEVVKVLDFGIAKETVNAVGPETKTGEVMGSPHYMSPEQARADKGIDHRADLWSLGVILYRMLTGALPFPGDVLGAILSRILVDPVPPVASVAPDLPASLDRFFAKAMAKSKEARFQSVRELADAFLQIAGEGRVSLASLPTLSASGSGFSTPFSSAEAPAAPGAPATVSGLPTLPLASPASGIVSSTLTTANMARDPVARVQRSGAPWIAVALLAAVIVGGGLYAWSRASVGSSISAPAEPAARPAAGDLSAVPSATEPPPKPEVSTEPEPAPRDDTASPPSSAAPVETASSAVVSVSPSASAVPVVPPPRPAQKKTPLKDGNWGF